MSEKWNKRLDELFDEIVEWRRHMHMHPELSYQEVRTSAFIAEKLTSFGIDVKKDVGGGGVVGRIQGGKPGKTIALRADFDALPIQDEKDVSYKSQVPGVMHACGHDGHTAMLLGVAKVLSEHRESLAGNVILLHQHAEEMPPGGAIAMIGDGCLDDVDAVFGTHLWATIPYGKFGYKSEYFMAASDHLTIKIKGQGGHGSSPHQTIDVIPIGAQLISQLQLLVSRQIDPLQPAVVSIGTFKAGSAFNIIADTATITGTIRTFDEDVRNYIEREIRNIANHVCSAFHASCEVNYGRGYPTLYNHENETSIFEKAIKHSLEEDMLLEIPPCMGGEDFAYYLQKKPGMFFFTGAGNEKVGANYPHHHPRFDIDERSMLLAGKALLGIVYQYLYVSDEKAAEQTL